MSQSPRKDVSAKSFMPTKAQLLALVPLLVLAVLLLFIGVQQNSFLSLGNIRGLLISMAPILLLALGQTFVILTGGLDLGFAATASLGTVIIAMSIPELGAFSLLLALLVTSAIGFLNGFIVAYFQIPSFIATLGSLGIYSGIALAISNASNIRVSEGYEVVAWISDLRILELPVVAWLSIGLAVVAALVIAFVRRGKSIHAVGLAEPAVRMSGVSTFRVRLVAFTLCGLFSGLAAIILVASQHSGGPTIAHTLQLPAIAAVVVGGTAITGGVGGPLRTVIGAAIIIVLRVGFSAIGIDPAIEQIVYGIVIILAVVLTVDRTRLRLVK